MRFTNDVEIIIIFLFSEKVEIYNQSDRNVERWQYWSLEEQHPNRKVAVLVIRGTTPQSKGGSTGH